MKNVTPKGTIKKDSNSSMSLFVSLYLVILAFFILLNSISKIEKEKQAESINSLKDTFSDVKHDEDIPYIEQSSSAGKDVDTTSYFAPVKKIAADVLELTDAQIIETGNTMEMIIPVDKFYAPKNAQILERQEIFLNRMADELTKMSGGIYVDVEFMIGFLIGGTGPGTTEEERKLSIDRAGTFARYMVQIGVNPESVFIGVTEDETKDIRLTFTTRGDGAKEVTPNSPNLGDQFDSPDTPGAPAVPAPPTDASGGE
jgi:hypothetical protein